MQKGRTSRGIKPKRKRIRISMPVKRFSISANTIPVKGFSRPANTMPVKGFSRSANTRAGMAFCRLLSDVYLCI
jgi:hypothetical protein